MKRVFVDTKDGFPNGRIKGKELLYLTIIYLSVFTVSGCSTSSNQSVVLAPSPPDGNGFSQIIQEDQLSQQPVSDDLYMSPMLAQLMASGFVHDEMALPRQVNPALIKAMDGMSSGVKTAYKCRLKDRFDRKAVLAYEWDRSRFSMDVDGINMSGDGEYGMRVEYRLRFQPEKKPRELCRYNSNWQGLIGSGYNEFFVREDGSVWEEIDREVKDVRKKVTNYTERLF